MSERKRVMVVEDDQDHRDIYEALLGTEYALTVCPSAEDALERIDGGGEFDLVVCDMHLFGKTGLEVLDHLKKKKRLDRCPVVFCSSERDPELRARALAEGAKDFVFKPFKPDQLRAALKAALASA